MEQLTQHHHRHNNTEEEFKTVPPTEGQQQQQQQRQQNTDNADTTTGGCDESGSNTNNNNKNNNCSNSKKKRSFVITGTTTVTTTMSTTMCNTSNKKIKKDENDIEKEKEIEISTLLLSPKEEITGLRLEAIFYPKFDNEKITTKTMKSGGNGNGNGNGNNSGGSSSGGETSSSLNVDVRSTILKRLQQQKGYIEISLKHSGSLVLWSGGSTSNRYYSKNASQNQFTAVASILLQQWLARAWYNDNNNDNNNDDGNNNNNNNNNNNDHHTKDDDDPYYERLSSFITQNRLTIALEVCTSRMLGDHAQMPLRDYIVVTAIACLKTGTFYTTPQLLKFCHHWRLPHNDVWCIFPDENDDAATVTTVAAAEKLFNDIYYGGGASYSSSDDGSSTSSGKKNTITNNNNTLRETGTTSTTIEVLTDVCHTYIPSLIPHSIFQGSILEGFIIRYVKYDTIENKNYVTAASKTRTALEKLATSATLLLNDKVPSHRPPSYELYRNSNGHSSNPSQMAVWTTNLRQVYDSVIQNVDQQQLKLLESTSSTTTATTTTISPNSNSSLRTGQQQQREQQQQQQRQRQQLIVQQFTTKLREILLLGRQHGVGGDNRLPSSSSSSSPSPSSSSDVVVGTQTTRNERTFDDESTSTAKLNESLSSEVAKPTSFVLTTKKIHLPSLTEHLLLLEPDGNAASSTTTATTATSTETRKIARLLQRLDNIKGHVNYTLLEQEEEVEELEQEPETQVDEGPQNIKRRRRRLVCIVHVLHDQTFFKYQKALQQEQQHQQQQRGTVDNKHDDDEMPLYRGFCIELLTSSSPSESLPSSMMDDTNTSKDSPDTNDPMDVDVTGMESHPKTYNNDDDDGIDDRTLMLKMKLIPYMVRTFICRNHLKTIRNDGIEKYLETSNVMLKRWNVSEQCHAKWMPFFEGWALYVQQYDDQQQQKQQDQTIIGSMGDKDETTKKFIEFGPLTDSSYLEHLEYYTTLYESGKITTTLTATNSTPGSSGAAFTAPSGVNGICVVVVSQFLHEAKAIAERYAVDLARQEASSQEGRCESSLKPVPVLALEQAARMGRSKSCIVYTAIDFELSPQQDGGVGDTGDSSNSDKKKNKKKHKKGSSFKDIRQYMHEKVSDHSIIVCYGSGNNDIESYATSVGLSKGNMKKLMSIWYPFTQGYPCVERIQLDRSFVTWDSTVATPLDECTGTEISKLEDTRSIVDVSPEFVESCSKIRSAQLQVIDNLQKQQADKADPTKKNILVFFPGIPGCGKSSLVASLSADTTKRTNSGPLRGAVESESESNNGRNMIVKEGDVIGKKYWDIVMDDLSPPSVSSGKRRGKHSNKSTTDLSNSQTDQNTNYQPGTFIADKNVPPPSWSKIGQIVAESNTVPIAVLPDDSCLQTTTIQGSRNRDGSFNSETSHFYPFSLQFLAVCMLRVLNRPPNSHNGKLDSSTEEACMVVVQFFSFYRYISSESFISTMYRKMESETISSESIINLPPILVPVLKSMSDSVRTQSSGLPEDLELALKEALQLRHGYDANRVKKRDPNDHQIPEMEARLRACLSEHKEVIEGMTVPLEESQAAFISQLQERTESLKHLRLGSISEDVDIDVDSDQLDFLRKIKLVSLDVDRTSVYTMLNEVYSSADPATQQLLSSFLLQTSRSGDTSTGGGTTADTSTLIFPQSLDKEDSEFISNTHVTMGVTVGSNNTSSSGLDDNDKDQPQSSTLTKAKNLYDKFYNLQGRQVEIEVHGLLWNETNAALAVKVGEFTVSSTNTNHGSAPDIESVAASVAPATKNDGEPLPVPACENAFQHITIWCKTGSKSVLSNNLPTLVKDGKARRVDFTKSATTTSNTTSTTDLSTKRKLIGTISFWNHQNQSTIFQF